MIMAGIVVHRLCALSLHLGGPGTKDGRCEGMVTGG